MRRSHLALDDLGTFVGQQHSQHRAMAVCLVLAIATHRKVAGVGQGGEQFERVTGLGAGHFRAVFLAEDGPLSGGLGLLPQLHGLDARRDEVEKFHRAAARRPDPVRAALVEQLRRAGSVLWRERRRDELAVKLLTEVRDLFRDGGQLDEKRAAALDDALAVLADPDRGKVLAPVITAVEALRADAGDRTRL